MICVNEINPEGAGRPRRPLPLREAPGGIYTLINSIMIIITCKCYFTFILKMFIIVIITTVTITITMTINITISIRPSAATAAARPGAAWWRASTTATVVSHV